MSSNSSGRVPKLSLHKPSGRAVVRLDGKDIYVVKYGTEESRLAYQRTIGEWLQLGRQAPAAGSKARDITVGGLMVAYLEFARGYYRKNNAAATVARSSGECLSLFSEGRIGGANGSSTRIT